MDIDRFIEDDQYDTLRDTLARLFAEYITSIVDQNDFLQRIGLEKMVFALAGSDRSADALARRITYQLQEQSFATNPPKSAVVTLARHLIRQHNHAVSPIRLRREGLALCQSIDARATRQFPLITARAGVACFYANDQCVGSATGVGGNTLLSAAAIFERLPQDAQISVVFDVLHEDHIGLSPKQNVNVSPTPEPSRVVSLLLHGQAAFQALQPAQQYPVINDPVYLIYCSNEVVKVAEGKVVDFVRHILYCTYNQGIPGIDAEGGAVVDARGRLLAIHLGDASIDSNAPSGVAVAALVL